MNRSAANTQLDKFDCALDDASKAIEIDPTYAKGYSRRADAFNGLKLYRLAIEDYERALIMDPHNTRLTKRVAKTRQILQKDDTFLSSKLLYYK